MSDKQNRLRAIEMATGLAANGRIESVDVVKFAGDFAAFLDGDEG